MAYSIHRQTLKKIGDQIALNCIKFIIYDINLKYFPDDRFVRK